MTRLIDTTLRLLGQEPLAGRIPTGAAARPLLRAGRGRVPRARGDRRRLLPRGHRARRREPVGAHPPVPPAGHAHAARDGAARHLPGRRAARQGRPGAPLHPLRGRVGHRHLPAARPAQRRRTTWPCRPRPSARPGGRLYAGLVYADAPGGDDFLVERARRLRELGADRIMLHDPAGRARARRGVDARHAPARGRRRARRPLLPGPRRHGARRLAGGRPRRRRPGRDGRLPGRDRRLPRQRRAVLAGARGRRRRPRPRPRPGVGDRDARSTSTSAPARPCRACRRTSRCSPR